MIIRKYILSALSIAVGLFSHSSVQAGNNKLELQNIQIESGTTEATLSVLLTNEDKISGFQCDLYLPDGVQVAVDEYEDYLIEMARTTAKRHSISTRTMSDGALRLVCSSMTNATFSGNSGAVLTLTLNIKEGLAAGDHIMSLKNIVLTDPSAARYTSDDTTAKLTVEGGAPVTPVTVTAKSYTRQYGEANPTFEYTVEGAELEGTPEIICEATASSPVGEYPIIIRKGSVTNDNDTYVNGTLTITKAPLIITAKSYSISKGESIPTFEVEYSGFKNGETSSVLSKQPSITCSATSSSGPGTYDIIVSGAEAGNYEIQYVQGTLTITPSAGANVLSLQDVTLLNGATEATLSVLLTNEDKISGFQCDLYLPDGVQVAVDEYDDYLIEMARTTAKRHSISTRTMSDGALRLVCSSMTNATFSGNSGAVLTLTLNIRKGLAAGDHIMSLKNIVLTDPSAARYTSDDTTAKLMVEDAKPVSVTAKSYTRQYGEANPTFEYTVEGAELEGTPEIICEAAATSPVGTYPIVIKKGSVTNSNDSYVNGTLTITKAPLTITAKSYSIKQGDALPTFEAEYKGFKNNETSSVLSKQPSISCEATSASAPGTYDIVVSGAEAGNYEISFVKGTLTITQADPVKVTANSYTITYGDALPEFGFTSEGATLSGTPSISCEATSTSPVGTYPIVISKGSVTNYNDSYVNGTLTITKAPLEVGVGNYTKKQGEANPEFTITYSGFKNNETEAVLKTKPTATTTATESSEPGEYAITVSGGEAENYTLSYKNGKLTVVKADAIVITANSYTREYGEANPTFEYTVEGAELEGTPEIICEATAESPAGEYPIIIKKGSVANYNDTYINGTLTITKAPLEVGVGNYTKKQGEANPEFTITYSGFKNNETEAVLKTKPTATTTATESSEPGEYDITVGGGEAENYTLSYKNGKLTVVKADAIVITAKSYTREYGEANPTFEYTVEGAELEGTPEIICEATPESPVGEYPIIIKKGSVANYNDTYINGTLTITKAPLEVGVGNYTKKQGEANPEFTITYYGFKNNETENVLKTKPTATTTATESSEPGEYAISVSGGEAENYTLSYKNGKLTVVKADAIVITANSYTREYGEANPTFEYTVEGAELEGTPEIICEATAESPAGEYPIIIKKGSVENYNDTYINGTLTITKAPLTVTVESCERKPGEETPEFVLTYSGWKLNDDESVLDVKPTASTEATTDSPVGEYAITIGGGEDENYYFVYVDGVLTVTGIEKVFSSKSMVNSGIYDLKGRKIDLSKMPNGKLRKGIYIINGKRVLIK